MKVERIIFWGFIIIIALMIPYLSVFFDGLSSNQSDWGNFGSYMSGTLGPIFSLLSILVVIRNVEQQIKDNNKNIQMQLTAEKQNIENERIIKNTERLFRTINDIHVSYTLIHELVPEVITSASLDDQMQNRLVNEYYQKGLKAINEAVILSRLYCIEQTEREIRLLLDYISFFFITVQVDAAGRIISTRYRQVNNLYKFHQAFNPEVLNSWFNDVNDLIMKQVPGSIQNKKDFNYSAFKYEVAAEFDKYYNKTKHKSPPTSCN